MAQPREAKPPPLWMVRRNNAVLRRCLKIGSQHLLSVRGWKTGDLRSTPVSIATVAGTRYIVAASADARGPILRAFLEQVRGGVRFFGSSDADEVAAAADRYPVFRIDPT